MTRRRIGIAAFVIVAGCVDIDPVTVPPPPVMDAAPPPDSAEPIACDLCLAAPDSPGPGCGDEVAVCLGDTRCTAILECTAPLRCYEKATQADVNDCGLPCFKMIVGNSLPTDLIMMLLGIASCAQNVCGAICHPQ
jgi:hypothetical protein